MIRPFTCVCFLLACGSGLYLYQAKHRVQTIDLEIQKAVRATSELREQTRVLHAEWTLQSDPQRLQALSDQLLNLKTVTPGQFTSMVDLDGRLPPVRGPESPPSEPLPVPIADGSQPEEPAAIPLPPPKPANWTAAGVQSQSDGELFWKISNGRGAMPPWKHLPEQERWEIVNYIRTLKGK